jgi:hypothetical protein
MSAIDEIAREEEEGARKEKMVICLSSALLYLRWDKYWR